MRLSRPLLAALVAAPIALAAQTADSVVAPIPAALCSACAGWNREHAPFRVHGNTWYVGTDGLSALLITSPRGHILIDAGLPESAPLIIANVRRLGFVFEDVRLVVNSHAHYDHAGGLAMLQRASGAEVAAHPWSARVMRAGRSVAGDPQLGLDIPYPPVSTVREITDGTVLRVGDLAITAHFTGGHTPGGTTWTWRSCEGDRCADVVYADSQTPVSADDFFYTRNATYPNAVADFERAHRTIENLSCDILVTPHPGASSLFDRHAARERGDASAMLAPGACTAYAANARRLLSARVARERK